MSKRDVSAEVRAAIRAWGKAKDGEAGARALADARQKLSPEHAAELVRELADVSAELLLAMLTKEEGLTPDAKPVDVNGVELHPKQAERLGAWLEDQPRVARALGLDGPAWQRLIEAAMTRLGQSGEAKAAGAEVPAAVTAAAQKLVGGVAGAFENRPEAGKSAKAGLQGLLAARGFKKPGK